jgi:catechol 2,3-dioxygenase-like lactoylglutathione lyase family enzyme
MFKPTAAFSGFSVDDLEKAKAFYTSTLGLTVEADGVGARVHLPGGGTVFFYPKPDHQPATFTILNFEVENVDDAVDDLATRGVQVERYENIPGVDAKGIMRGREHNTGPDVAWFTDPARNVLAVLH